MDNGLIYKKLIEIQKEVDFIAKTREAQGYKFRGIDDALQYYNQFFKKHGVVIIMQPPIPGDIIFRERITMGNNQNWYDVLAIQRFKLVAEDGSFIEGGAYGSGRDNGGTVAGKLMAYALKYFLNYMFLTPTQEPEDDSEMTNKPPQEKPMHTQYWTETRRKIADLIETDKVVTPEGFKAFLQTFYNKQSTSELTDDEIASVYTKCLELKEGKQ